MSRKFNAARRLALIMSAPLIWPLLCGAAFGQDASVPPSTSADDGADSGQIEDIVVTAQRRTESAQSVPISLQSFSTQSLQQAAVRNTEDLTSVVGGLLVQPTAARPAIFVRGVGTNSSNTTPAVLTFVDGVYMPFGQSMDLANISSLEVLKGPQGTLFGRNATGGVIQITTRPPSETTGARVEVGYGNYETVDATAYVTGGLATGIAADLSLRYSNQNKGFGINVFNGEDVFRTKKFSGRGRLRFDVSESTNITISGDYNEIDGNLGTTVAPAFGFGTVFAGGAIRRRGPGEFYPGDYDINAGPITPGFKSREWGASVSLETQFSDLTFRSITAYRESSEKIQIDFDGTPANAINLRVNRDPRTSFTQELQLLSNSGGAFEWVAGLFYYRAKAVMAPFSINTNAAFATDIDESGAVYAQASYEILPDTKLTVGGRYTIEKRSIEGYVEAAGVTVPGRSGYQSQTFKEPTWRVALDHKFGRDMLVYASVSRGFNAGFFNQSSLAGFNGPAQNPPVRPEFLTAYEIGTKADLFDRRLRVNLSAFLYNYKDLQQQIYNQGAVVTINAGSSQIKGFDFEVTAKPTRSLTLSISGTYLDTKYKSYPLAPNYVPQPNGSILAVSNIDAAGNTITNTPKWTYTVSASHVLETSIGHFTSSANLNYRGETFIDPANRYKLPTRYLLNFTERWTSKDERLFASIWAKNLLDKQYDFAVNILTPVGLVGIPAAPRTYGVTLGFNF